ncbi:FKBP-type peptidyl-prolyl cis-trans isomerase [Parasalinivibrio latis]
MKFVAIILLILAAFFIYQRNANNKAAAANIEAGKVFLAENQKHQGVITTESGLQYEVLAPGTGTIHPKATDRVLVHYHGTLVDGSVFDSSVDRGEPIAFGLNQVIKGWTEGLQTMVEGEKTRLFIPSELAYGNRGVGSIPPGSVLIFDVELLKINP